MPWVRGLWQTLSHFFINRREKSLAPCQSEGLLLAEIYVCLVHLRRQSTLVPLPSNYSLYTSHSICETCWDFIILRTLQTHTERKVSSHSIRKFQALDWISLSSKAKHSQPNFQFSLESEGFPLNQRALLSSRVVSQTNFTIETMKFVASTFISIRSQIDVSKSLQKRFPLHWRLSFVCGSQSSMIQW